MRYLKQLTALVAFAPLATAIGQPINRVADSRIEVGPWVYHAVYTSGVGAAGVTVDNLVAFAKSSATSGNNLVGIWYSRNGEAWEAKSWNTADATEIAKSIAQELNLEESEWGKFSVTPTAFSGTPETPKEYSGGVLADDPMAFVLASSVDRDALVQFLVATGYKAADVELDKSDACTTGRKLDRVSSDLSTMISDGDVTIRTMSTLANSCELAGTPRGPAPTRPAQPATPPAWSPPGTVPTAPGWTPGGWPAGPGWYCFGTVGGGSCFCSRDQRWGRWESTTCSFLIWSWTCTRWHEIIERESCNSNSAPACPAGGPPPPGSICDFSY